MVSAARLHAILVLTFFSAVIYGLSTSHSAFRPLLSLSPYIHASALIDMNEIKPLSSLGGKSVAAAALMVLFGIRALAAKMQAVSAPVPVGRKE